jgi:hypothetical protein
MSKEWHARVSLEEALRNIANDLNLPVNEGIIRVDINSIADKGLPSERLVQGYVLLAVDGSEIKITKMTFTNT